MESAPEAVAAARLRRELASRLAVWQDRLAAGSLPAAGGEMPPQVIENTESDPEKGMAREAAERHDAGTKLSGEFSSVLAAPALAPLAPEPPLTGDREMAPQAIEKAESAPQNGAALEASDAQDAGTAPGGEPPGADQEPALAAPARNPLAPAASLTGR